MMNWKDTYREIHFSFKHSRVRMGGYLFLVTLLLLIINSLLVWFPVYQDYSEVWEENKKNQSDIQRISQRNKLAITYNENLKRVSQIENKLNVRNSQSEINYGVSQLAQKNHISIITESYSEGASENGYSLLNQNLVLEGKYSSIRQFLKDINYLAVWTVPQEIQLKTVNDNKYRIRASLKLAIYTRAEFE